MHPTDHADSAVYCWDFFGPDADETARHFLRHLTDYLERRGIQGECALAVRSEQSGHFAATCRAPVTYEPELRRTLKPHRKTAS